MWTAATTGFLTAFALILAIGAQNAFVLKQGIARQHVFWICLVCALSDAILIALGVAGFGAIVKSYPSLPKWMAIGGAAFLIFYALTRFWAAHKFQYTQDLSGKAQPLYPALITCLALTWLNPHVYLDTLGLIGAVSTQFEVPTLKLAFGIGAVTSSFTFFFGLGYGARLLAPIMQTPQTWKILDILIGVLMLYLAYGLIRHI